MRNLAKKRRAVRVVRGDATKGVTGKPPRDRGRVVTLAAEPTAVDLDLTKTVVIVVDMQNDFGSRGGMTSRNGPWGAKDS